MGNQYVEMVIKTVYRMVDLFRYIRNRWFDLLLLSLLSGYIGYIFLLAIINPICDCVQAGTGRIVVSIFCVYT